MNVIPLAQAQHLVRAAVAATQPTTRVALSRAHGYTLAHDLRAADPWPTTDRSAMDGFAIVAGAAGLPALTQLAVIGQSLAGHPFGGTLQAGQAVTIMTGGVVPFGADAVVPVEDTNGFGKQTVTLRVAARAGQNVRKQGSEVAMGQLLIARGTRLRAAEVGVLAVLGHVEVEVFTPPVVAVLATGDEVVDIGAHPLPHQVRNSNAHALMAQVRESGGEPLDLGIAKDDADDLCARIAHGLSRARVLLTIGGVSKGTHDLVHGTLSALGVAAHFHGIELKPGKPTFFGSKSDGGARIYVFGLPGNPASCFTVFDLLVRPLLHALLGAGEAPYRAQRSGAMPKQNAREQAIPARLATDAQGHALAVLDQVRPSGDPFSLLAGDGYALLPAGVDPQSLAQVAFVPYAAGAVPAAHSGVPR